MKTLKIQGATVALTVFFALTLAGCGGGSSSRSTAAAPTPQQEVQRIVTARGATMAVRDIAGATPRAGSVTQTSNTNNAGVTQDTIAADASYASGELVFTVTRTDGDNAAVTVDTSTASALPTRSGYEFDGKPGRLALGRTETGGLAVVQVFTDRTNQADTDYLVGGVWLFAPEGADSTSDMEMGAFLDESRDTTLTPTAYLMTTATATYQGFAHGMYIGFYDGDPFSAELRAPLSLTASFGSSPAISGSISELYERGRGGIEGPQITEEWSPWTQDEEVLAWTLESAAISTTDAGGFFTGDVTGTLDGVTPVFSGKWGGQFYGDAAETVGGTIGYRYFSTHQGTEEEIGALSFSATKR